MTARLLVAALMATGSLPVGAQTLTPRPEPTRTERCEQERKNAADAGWDLSTFHLLCEANVTPPTRLRDVKPQYTPEAMRQKIQGTVMVAAIVDADGVIREAKVVKSLDKDYGLDEQALAAVRAMSFKPAELQGRSVRAIVMFDMAFTLRLR